MDSPPDPIYPQSGVIPFRRKGDRLEILLITSWSGKRWIVPKGLIEPDMTPAQSAAQEALEEAGVEGTVSAQPIGRYRYEKWGGTCIVDLFLMEVRAVHETWDEADVRRREWVSLEEAVRRVGDQALAEILQDLNPADFTVEAG
ncbi:MAG: NUDIX hydrolase [Phycisphaerae bacterium]|nr:NUDIX hydrolase [Phycisphaerae bacterium]